MVKGYLIFCYVVGVGGVLKGRRVFLNGIDFTDLCVMAPGSDMHMNNGLD